MLRVSLVSIGTVFAASLAIAPTTPAMAGSMPATPPINKPVCAGEGPVTSSTEYYYRCVMQVNMQAPLQWTCEVEKNGHCAQMFLKPSFKREQLGQR